MEQLIIIAHVLIALSIIALVLLQQGKGADMGASFGAGSSQTVFGPRGSASVLTRLTAVLVAAFFATSFALAIVAKHKATAAGEVSVPVPAAVHTAPKEAVPAPKPAQAPDVPAASGSANSPAASGSDVPVPTAPPGAASGSSAGTASEVPKQ